MTVTLQVDNLSKSFGGVHAVVDATVHFHPGRINAIIGPNGSGKTTFFNCVTGMIRSDSGTVTLAGKDVTRSTPDRIARLGLARLHLSQETVQQLGGQAVQHQAEASA